MASAQALGIIVPRYKKKNGDSMKILGKLISFFSFSNKSKKKQQEILPKQNVSDKQSNARRWGFLSLVFLFSFSSPIYAAAPVVNTTIKIEKPVQSLLMPAPGMVMILLRRV